MCGLATNCIGSPEGFALGRYLLGQVACATGLELTEGREEPWKSPDRSTFHSLQRAQAAALLHYNCLAWECQGKFISEVSLGIVNGLVS